MTTLSSVDSEIAAAQVLLLTYYPSQEDFRAAADHLLRAWSGLMELAGPYRAEVVTLERVDAPRGRV